MITRFCIWWLAKKGYVSYIMGVDWAAVNQQRERDHFESAELTKGEKQ